MHSFICHLCDHTVVCITMKHNGVMVFRRQGVVSHCRIKSRAERGQVKYYLIENKLFDSLYGLITFYRQHPLKSHEFEQVLTEPVPQPESHRGKE